MIHLLLILLLYVMPHLDSNDLVDLKSFPTVMELERVIDAHSGPIEIPGGLIFGSEIVTTAYVSTIYHNEVL